MEPKEFEEQLTDLETRLDRVRALYENWFRGYEKLEPQIARKDVERRVYQLRKELPRNTGLRFRYNTLFQRYTTLTSYWQRTAKQIEEGTYRPQLQRLRRKYERQKELGRVAPESSERRGSELPPAQSYELNLDEQLNVHDLLDDLELDAVARAVDEPGPHAEPPPPVAPAPRAMATFAKPGAGSQGSAPKAAPRVMSESNRYSEPPPSQRQAAIPKGPAVPAPMTSGAPSPRVVPVPPPPTSPRMTMGDGALPPRPPPPVPGTSARMTMGDGALPPRPPVPPPPGSPITASGVRTAPTSPAQTTAARPAPRPVAPAAPPPEASLPEQRMKSLYDEYARARRNNNEGEVRYDALVKSIQKMLPELEKRHAGKQIDFEIVLKDGRVGLKPKAK